MLLGFIAGLIVGAGVVTLIALRVPTLFADPVTYFEKLERKIEKRLDSIEEGAKKEIKEALRDLAKALGKINLID